MPPSDASFNVAGALAIVEWTGVDSQLRYLYQAIPDPSLQVTFDIRYDATHGLAGFRICAPVGLKAPGYANEPLYLHIYPDRITSLNNDVSDAVPDVVRSKLGLSPRRLQFTLAQPADLIVPPVSLAPRNKGQGDMLDSLKLLAQETRFNVFFLDVAVPEGALRTLCDDIGTRALKSVGGWVVQNLYGRVGGKVLAGAELCSPAPKTAPPSYDALAPPPPEPHVTTGSAATSSGPSKKRRRDSASPPAWMHEPDFTAICKKLIDEALARNRQEAVAGFNDRLEQLQKTTTEELQQFKSMILAHVDQRFEELEGVLCSVDDVDEHITQHVSNFEDLIDVKIEDHVGGIRIELEDFVGDEVANAEDRIMQRVRDASWTVSIDE